MKMNRFKLKEIANIVNGATPSSLNVENYGGNIVWITPNDLSKQKKKYIYIGERNITEIGYNSCSTKLLPVDSILLSSRAPIGLIAINKVECCTNQGFKNLVINKEKCNVEFLYYYLKYHIKEIEKLGSGTTFKEVSKGLLEDYEVLLPLMDLQNKISKVLSNIDNKIELNNKINSELEAMAKTIYDYWFLQFEFPNEEGKPYKSSGGKMVWNEELKREIPEGWEIKSIFDELSVQYGFPFATDKFTDVKTDIPVVRIRDILTNTISTYSNENVDEKYRLNEQDLLIGMDGNFHMNYWIDNTSYLNQRSVRLRTKDTSNVSIIQVKYNIAPYIKAKEERAGGSTVGHLSDKDLKELKILVPKTKKLREILDNTLMKIVKNRKENQELTSLRDFLLPLLMNGQVGFKEE